MEYTKWPIEIACDHAGSQAEMARLLGVTPPVVHQWANRSRPVPADKCVAIERVTAGAVTVEELRADCVWTRVPDPSWPHPRGRPLLDFFGSKASPIAEPALVATDVAAQGVA